MIRAGCRAIRGAGVTLLLATQAGCGPHGAAPSSSPTGGTSAARITFMVFGDPAELRAYQRLVETFESDESGVDVELVHVPSQADYRKRLAMDLAAGSPADVFLLNYRRYASFARRGALEPLGPFLARSGRLKEADFYPQALAPFRWEGELIGIPQNLSSLVVYYNRNLFDQAKVPYPKADWNWEQFVETAKRLTRDTDGDGKPDQYGLGTEVSLQRLAPFLWQNGGELLDDPKKPTSLALFTPPCREALQWFVDLRGKHGVAPGEAEERAEDSESRFQNGRTAMFLNSRRGVPTYREIRSFTWDVAPLPRGKQAAGILHADGYFMPKSARNQDAIWKFIEFASSTPGQTLLAASGRTVPSLRAVAESPAFLSPDLPPQNSRVFLDTLPQIRAVPLHENWADLEEVASDELRQAFYGNVLPVMAVARMVRRTQRFFAPE